MFQYSLFELAKHLDAKVIGDGHCQVTGIGTVEAATAKQITFLASNQFKTKLAATKACAVVVKASDVDTGQNINWLVVDDPYLAYAYLSQHFDHYPKPSSGIHPSAVVADDVSLGAHISIGANAVVEPGVVLAEGTIIGAGCYIGHHVELGAGTHLHANVTVYANTKIGERCIIHSGVVIGADGFGIANNKGSWVKICQLGRVLIGSDVEIGANTCIDRGALDNTVVKDGVKIDNMCHLAHNVQIGENTVMAGFSAVAGSAKIGRQCMIAGGVGVLGHTEMADSVTATARTFVSASVSKAGSVVSSGTTMQDARSWRRCVNRFKQLDELFKRIVRLEKQIKNSKNDDK